MNYYYVTLAILTVAYGAQRVVGQQVCGIHQQPCGRQCFYPEAGQQCLGSNPTVCGFNESLCDGSRCYKPYLEEQCIINGTMTHICPMGHKVCINRCYDYANGQRCLLNDQGSYLVCGNGEKVCGTVCYHPFTKSCHSFNSRAVLCNAGQTLCGAQCYSPDAGQVCLNSSRGFVVCQGAEAKLCGDQQCYNPNSGDNCFINGTQAQVCRRKSEPCPQGPGTCYTPAAGEKCHLTTHGLKVCGYNQLPCGSYCYNPKIGQQCYLKA